MVILFISVMPFFFLFFFFLVQLIFLPLNTGESSLFLITPLEEFRVLWGYLFIFRLGKVFIFSKKFVFIFSFNHCAILKFLTVFGLIFVDMIFCIRNGDSFVNGLSSINSNIINFWNGNSGCIFSSELSSYVRSLEIVFWFSLGYVFENHKESLWVSLAMFPTHHGASHGDVPKGKPFA